MEPEDDFIPLELEVRRDNSSIKIRQETSLEMASNLITNSMYMLGGLTNPLKWESSEKKQSKAECLSLLKQTIWITYRKNFPELMDSQHISDTGWGCMIRVGQMLLASALRRYQQLHYSKLQDDNISILSSFLDDDQSKGTSINYSIQKIVRIGNAEFKLQPGTWLTPSHISYIIEQLHNTNPLRGYQGLKVLVFNNNTLFYEQVLNKMGYEVCKCSKILLKCKQCHSKLPTRDNAVLIMLLSRIGLDSPHQQYREVVMKMMELKQFVGMIGGKPKKALFFLGHESKKELIYLDPHYVQESVTRKNLESVKDTFFCDSYRTIDYRSIDPSLGFSFLINNIDELEEFYNNMNKIASGHKEQFFVYSEIKTPEYVKKELQEENKHSLARISKVKQMFKDDEDDGDNDFSCVL